MLTDTVSWICVHSPTSDVSSNTSGGQRYSTLESLHLMINEWMNEWQWLLEFRTKQAPKDAHWMGSNHPSSAGNPLETLWLGTWRSPGNSRRCSIACVHPWTPSVRGWGRSVRPSSAVLGGSGTHSRLSPMAPHILAACGRPWCLQWKARFSRSHTCTCPPAWPTCCRPSKTPRCPAPCWSRECPRFPSACCRTRAGAHRPLRFCAAKWSVSESCNILTETSSTLTDS